MAEGPLRPLRIVTFIVEPIEPTDGWLSRDTRMIRPAPVSVTKATSLCSSSMAMPYGWVRPLRSVRHSPVVRLTWRIFPGTRCASKAQGGGQHSTSGVPAWGCIGIPPPVTKRLCPSAETATPCELLYSSKLTTVVAYHTGVSGKEGGGENGGGGSGGGDHG